MDVALFMTVGTGIGPNKEEKIKSLAHGLLSSVIHYNPDNPVKRGYVDKSEHWRYSSGRDYIGLKGLVAVKPLI